MTLIQRSMASAERSFHKSLTALSKLQNARGFVPQKTVKSKHGPSIWLRSLKTARGSRRTTAPAGFVPQKTVVELAAFEYMGYFPENHAAYVESLVNS